MYVWIALNLIYWEMVHVKWNEDFVRDYKIILNVFLKLDCIWDNLVILKLLGNHRYIYK